MRLGKSWWRVLRCGPLLGLTGLAPAAENDPLDALMARDAWASCTYCHGVDGAIDDAQIPAIAGQSASYLRKQIADFRAGRRVDPSGMMGSALFLLAPADDAAVIGYFSARPRPVKTQRASAAMGSAGARLFTQGTGDTPACQRCHAKPWRPDASDYPVLQGLSAGYIARQLRRFRAGERTNDPGGIMRRVAQALSDSDIDAVAQYLDGG